jgi:hypothetical protein
MATSMTEPALDRRYCELSGLSLVQLERTLTAANLLLDAWRKNNRSGFDGLVERPSRSKGNSICPWQ